VPYDSNLEQSSILQSWSCWKTFQVLPYVSCTTWGCPTSSHCCSACSTCSLIHDNLGCSTGTAWKHVETIYVTELFLLLQSVPLSVGRLAFRHKIEIGCRIIQQRKRGNVPLCNSLRSLFCFIWLFYRVFLQQQDRTSTVKFQNRASTVACRGMPWQTCECNREISWNDGFTCHRELSVYAVSVFARFEGLLLSKHSLLWQVPVSLAHSRCVNARIGSVALGIVANTGLLIFPADVFGCFQKRSSSWQELAPRLWSALWPTPVRSLHLQATTGSLYKPFERFWNCKKTAWTELYHRQSLLAKPISVFRFPISAPCQATHRAKFPRNPPIFLDMNNKKYQEI